MEFWQAHGQEMGLWFLLGIAIFPRITMLVAVATPFGFLAWIGWLIAPHFTVAVLATTMYWDTNPGLCIMSWVLAIVGTGSESSAAKKARDRRR